MPTSFAMDAQTVINIDLIVISVIAIVTLQNALQYRQIIAARWWAASSILLFIGVLMLGQEEPYFPLYLQTLVLNSVLLGQAMLVTIGLANIACRPEPKKFLAGLLAVHLAFAEYFSVVVENQTYRALSFSVVLTVTLLMSLEILVRMWRHQKIAAIPLLIAIMSLQVLVFLFYAAIKLSTISTAPVGGYTMSSLPSALVVAFLGFMLAQLLQTFALMMLTGGYVQRDLSYLASHDPLTGAMTRTSFFERGQAAAQEALRYQRAMAVIFLDLDHFKSINDRFGHAAGDFVLQDFAARVRHRLRAGDSLGRWGGEEFAIILPSTDRAGAVMLGERLRAAIADPPFGWQGQEIAVTVSIGICAAEVGAPIPFDLMLKQADASLYAAKALGRNRAELWDEANQPKDKLAQRDDQERFSDAPLRS